MSKVTSQADLGKIKEPLEFMRFCSQLLSDLLPAFNGKIEFDKNILSQTVSVEFPTANANVIVQHNLNKSVNFIVVNKNVSCDVYAGTDSTSSQVGLKCNTGSSKVTLILF